MSDSKKLYTAKEAALAVLTKAKEILGESSLMKAEMKKDGQTLGAAIGFPGAAQTAPTPTPSPMPKSEMKKYEPENDSKPGNKYGKIEKDVKPIERDWNEYEVKPGSSKDSMGPRLKEQVSPSTNPKEEAKGNNKPDGMEPEFEFKDKVSKELAKEKSSHMVKSQSGMHTVFYKSATFEKSETENNDLQKAESKHDRCVKDVERNSPDVKNPHAVCVAEGVKPAKWKKSEINPDEKEDAELGEKVEHDVEEHHKEMGNEVSEEGHDMTKPEDKAEASTESAVIPRLIGSAKLSKFMEYRHAKKKAQMAQQAAGHEATGAPQPGSSQAGQSDAVRSQSQPTKGDMDKAESNFDKLKHKIENKEGYSEKGAAGAAYEAGKAKYGKAGMAAKAAAGRKK